jgi:membrane dipeptidase
MTDLSPLMIDGHEDLAWNILAFGRDYTLPASETRQREQGGPAPQYNGDTLLGWPDYQRGRVAVVFSTLFAAPVRRKLGDWDTQHYTTDQEAHQVYWNQLQVYHRLVDEHPDQFRLVLTRPDLESVLAHWQRTDTDKHPVGLVVLMENAEGVRPPADLEEWWAGGVRIIGPAWAGTRYCGGTREPGPLTPAGRILLERMAEFGFVLDLSHMDAQAALQALDRYPRQVIVSHGNALALLPGSTSNRHLPDEVLRGLIQRDGVIGVVPNNNFLKVDWKECGGRQSVSIELVVAQIDYICQMAGDARHAALGSDFDGGFGLQSAPAELDTVADLQILAPRLAQKGYTESDIAAILGQNWLEMLRKNLPEVA